MQEDCLHAFPLIERGLSRTRHTGKRQGNARPTMPSFGFLSFPGFNRWMCVKGARLHEPYASGNPL